MYEWLLTVCSTETKHNLAGHLLLFVFCWGTGKGDKSRGNSLAETISVLNLLRRNISFQQQRLNSDQSPTSSTPCSGIHQILIPASAQGDERLPSVKSHKDRRKHCNFQFSPINPAASWLTVTWNASCKQLAWWLSKPINTTQLFFDIVLFFFPSLPRAFSGTTHTRF